MKHQFNWDYISISMIFLTLLISVFASFVNNVHNSSYRAYWDCESDSKCDFQEIHPAHIHCFDVMTLGIGISIFAIKSGIRAAGISVPKTRGYTSLMVVKGLAVV